MRGRHHATGKIRDRTRRVSKKLQDQQRYDPEDGSDPHPAQEMNNTRKHECENDSLPTLPRYDWMRHAKQSEWQQAWL
jgi:hypothetical protein